MIIKKCILIKALNAAIARQNALVDAGAKGRNALGKAYELKVLTHICQKMRHSGFALSCTLHNSNSMALAYKPCSANRKIFDYIEAENGVENLEIWTSLQFTTLSFGIGTSRPAPPKYSDRHELDVGVFSLFRGKYPRYDQVAFSASCKCNSFHKAFIRELLGLKRELGIIVRAPLPSSAQWFVNSVVCIPPSPTVLYSDNLSIGMYSRHLSHLGAYVAYLK